MLPHEHYKLINQLQHPSLVWRSKNLLEFEGTCLQEPRRDPIAWGRTDGSVPQIHARCPADCRSSSHAREPTVALAGEAPADLAHRLGG